MSDSENDRRWSAPGADVLTSIRDRLDEGRSAVVATVVGVDGSAYRRPGAKMLVEEDGSGRGHITAGCLEDEVYDLAAEILDEGEPRIETYDLMDDEDDVWGLGVGCNGIIDVLLEPLDEAYAPLAEAIDSGEPIGVVTVLDGPVPVGAKAYYRDGEIVSDFGTFPEDAIAAIEAPAETLVEEGKADTVSVETEEGTIRVFVDGIQPAPRLLVFGTGHDARPVVELAGVNGFRVTVVGFRGAIDLEERFPTADDHVTATPGTLTEAVDLDNTDAAVVMTHNFLDDRLTVEALVDARLPYVGLMGPRERFEEMLDDFEEEGRTFTDEALDRLYTPVGLDLGDGSPYGIATSIVAEVVAVHNSREPKHLADREGPIHDRVEIEN